MHSKSTDMYENGKKLPLTEEFYTLQGEGYHAGKAAYFIRIGGCDIGCSWCDSKLSWKADVHLLVDIAEIAKKAMAFPAKAVVVTGGEPTSYNLDPLCALLKKNNIKTFIETSGAYPLTGIWDWICLSPKKNKKPLASIYKKANELKIIVSDFSDLIWAEENATKVSADCKLFLQPEWSKFKVITSDIVEYVKWNPEWQVSLQSHKFMKIP